MILNIEPHSIIYALRAIDDVQYLDFYLTGSRYFNPQGTQRGSDLDFFVQDEPNARSFLSAHGFRKLPGHGYNDSQTVDVYRFGCIDIQVVKDAVLKQKVQERIRANFPHYFTDKTEKEQREIWNLWFTFLGETQTLGI